MKKLIILASLIGCLSIFAVKSDDSMCVVSKVVDGDTIHAICNGITETVRLVKIDSYESKHNQRSYRQAYEQHITTDQVIENGKKAAIITTQELAGKQVVIKTSKSRDRYNRELGEVFLNGVSINDKLLKEHPDVFLKY